MRVSRRTRLSLRVVALGYLFVLLAVPIGVILWRTFEPGLSVFIASISTPAAKSALNLSLLIVAITVPVNVVFGVATALALVRGRFRGRGLLQAVVDLPFAVSPIVVGVSLIMLWGVNGWFGALDRSGFQVIFGIPGMVLATIFVTLPFVVREVEPVLHEIGQEQEQAASTLGANGWQTFWRITLPAIRWGLTYGVVLTVARALGEFGAVIMVSLRLPRRLPDADAPRALPLHRRPQHLRRVCRRHPPHGHRAARAAAHDRARPQEERPMITVTSARKDYGSFTALDDVSLDIPSGSLTALLGPSGSGKSTLLRAIAGLEEARLGHRDDRGPRRHGRAAAATRHRLRLPALRRLQAHDGPRQRRLRPDDPQAPQGRDGQEGRRACSRSSGSTASSTATPRRLSGGQRQRMALARALAVDPQVLLLDEPFGALDAKVRTDLRQWLRRLHDEVHVTTVLVTHDQEEALDVADRIAVLNKGRIEQVGDPVTLYERPANDFVMGFLGSVAHLGGQARATARHRPRARPRDGPGPRRQGRRLPRCHRRRRRARRAPRLRGAGRPARRLRRALRRADHAA